MADKPKSNRRDFLFGRAAGEVIVYAAGALADRAGKIAERLDPSPPAEPVKPGYVLSISRRAMACDFEIRMNADSKEQESCSRAAMAALDLIEDLEEQLTVYRETSEVIEINLQAATAPAFVEAGLFGLLEQADRLHHETGGAFDLTSGPLSRAWGFSRREGRLPSEEEIAQARELVGWGNIALDAEQQTISFAIPGVEINVNSIGKGYALDRATELLLREGAESFVFHGGRSTLIARGNRTGQTGWPAGLRHPLYPQRQIAEFQLVDEALSTSGSATQFFRHRGKRYGHILDPRTGWPAEGMFSATVIAPTAAQADALSTAFYVMGPDAVAQYCESRPQIKSLLVLPTSREGEVQVQTCNLG